MAYPPRVPHLLRRLCAASSLLLAVTLVSAPGTAQAPADAGAPGIGDPYFPLDGNGGIDVRRYDIRASYDLQPGVLRGRTVVRLVARQRLTRFNLDLLLPVRSVRVDGRPARFWKSIPHELTIKPAVPLARGAVAAVEVVYAGRPGQYSYARESNWLASGAEFAAVNQPHMAPWWFPANDHPSDKAVVDVRMRVPNGRQVISNGSLLGVARGPASSEWHWRAPEPMAPYLAFVTGGRFRIERTRTPVGQSLIAVSRRFTADEQRWLLTQLRRTPDIVRRLERAIGQPYPFRVTGGVASGVLSGFALENQTRPVYPGFVSTDLLAHELAHQWFGDKVTVRRWRDIWLNEGFASWFEMVVPSSEAEAARRLRRMYDATAASDPFWQVAPDAPGRDHIFDDAVYLRGAMTLMALRRRIGDTDFDAVIRSWAARRTASTTSDFVAVAERVSGEDLSEFFQAWLFDPGKPEATSAHGLS